MPFPSGRHNWLRAAAAALVLALALGLSLGPVPGATPAAGAAAVLGVPPLPPPPAPPPAGAAVDAAARRYALSPGGLRYVGGAWAGLPFLQKYLFHAKVLDLATGRVLTVALTTAWKPIEFDLAAAQEQVMRGAALGKLDPDLRLVARALAPTRPLKVAVWLVQPDTQSAVSQVLSRYPDLRLAPGRRPLPGCNLLHYKAFYQECLKAKEAAYLAQAQPLVDWLTFEGQQVTYVSPSAPLVFAEVAGGLLGRLAVRPDVAAVYLSRTYAPELNSAVPSLFPDQAWALGLNGTGTTVAVVDAERIAWENPFLTKGLSFNPLGPAGDHPTALAGAIASAHETYQGMARGAALLSANAGTWSDQDLVKASDWALGVGAAVFNLGFGADTASCPQVLDRYFDHLAREHGRLAVKSAGNLGGVGDTGNVTSPGLGYNVLTVGGVFDNNTGLTCTDDSRYPLSSFRDPLSLHGDRSEPDLSAVAQSVQTTLTPAGFQATGGWVSPQTAALAGTSLACALTSGAAALLIQYRPFLAYWPEAVRAVLLASALRSTYGPLPAGRLHDQEGAGTLLVDEAVRVLSRDAYSLFYGYRQDFPRWHSLDLAAGQKVRVALAWQNNPDWPADPAGQKLTSDFDLTVYDPAGGYLAGAYTWDNTCEVVEFTAPTAGTYRVVISAARLDTPYEHVCLAWMAH